MGRNVQVVCISGQLKSDLLLKIGSTKNEIEVLHDAAPSRPRIAKKTKESFKRYLASTIRRQVDFSCGYVGHLYEGRGIEVIIELAQRLPDVGFFVVVEQRQTSENTKGCMI